MQIIEVQADRGPNGILFPRSFSYAGQKFQIDSIGRRWEDEDGEHVLVMIQPNDRVYELLHARGIWYLLRGFSGQSPA